MAKLWFSNVKFNGLRTLVDHPNRALFEGIDHIALGKMASSWKPGGVCFKVVRLFGKALGFDANILAFGKVSKKFFVNLAIVWPTLGQSWKQSSYFIFFHIPCRCPFNMSGRTCWCRSHCSDSAPEKVIARNPIHWWRLMMSDPIDVWSGLFGHFGIRSVANGWARNEAGQRENRIALGVACHMVATIHCTSFFTMQNYLPSSSNLRKLNESDTKTFSNCWRQNGGLHRPRPWCSAKELSGNPTKHAGKPKTQQTVWP